MKFYILAFHFSAFMLLTLFSVDQVVSSTRLWVCHWIWCWQWRLWCFMPLFIWLLLECKYIILLEIFVIIIGLQSMRAKLVVYFKCSVQKKLIVLWIAAQWPSGFWKILQSLKTWIGIICLRYWYLFSCLILCMPLV